MIDSTKLAALCARPEQWALPLAEAMAAYDIDSFNRASMFLATCAHESARFSRLEENLNYSAAALLRVFPQRFTPAEAADYALKPARVANRAYAGRGGNGEEASGDGWRYRGRGPIQITLRDNYLRCGDAIGLPLLDNPDLLLGASAGAKAAAWFWWQAGCNFVADEGDFKGVSGLVNRGNRHRLAQNQEDRDQWLAKAQSALA